METIELAVNASLLAEVDRVTQSLDMTRAAFIQYALELALKQQQTLAKERRHAEGYARHPVEPEEFEVADSSLAWGES